MNEQKWVTPSAEDVSPVPIINDVTNKRAFGDSIDSSHGTQRNRRWAGSLAATDKGVVDSVALLCIFTIQYQL